MRRTAFNDGWEFSRGGAGYEPVVVPHDAMLGNRRDAEAPAGSASGYYYGDEYAYRKTFTLSADQARGALLLEFEGVYRDARIAVNGTPVQAPPYGFVPFFVDLSGLARAGENTVEVTAGNAGQPDCRWYSGGGIYRPVWLWEAEGAHIPPEGVRVTTLSCNPARVRVQVQPTEGQAVVSIIDGDGVTVARGTGNDLVLDIQDARLWSAEHPDLYRCYASLRVGNRIVDTAEASFGIRQLEWGPRGLFVNGRETLLRGGCIHCDNGILGAASFAESERRRVRLLKQAGFNAVRVAHNPAPAALLDACDELGMYVMDEAWDMWFMRKSAHDYAGQFLQWCDYDLGRMASRDYNHPSVIMYSIGNEVADPITAEGVQLERSMVELLHSLDSTRPVTCGLNLTMMVMERAGRGWYSRADGVAEAAGSTGAPRGSLLFNLVAQASGTGMTMLSRAPGADKLISPGLDALDIAGYNYGSARYGVDARKHPHRVIVGTETFPHELVANWEAVERYPGLIGDFMWAAWDYLGEAGAGAWAYTAEEAGFSKPWPWLIAGSGALDILGQPGAPAALAGAVWKTAAKPSIQVRPVNIMDGKTYKATWRGSDAIPSWSWAGCTGKPTAVEVYDGRAAAVRLELNGDELGTRKVRDCLARFQVEYRPGTLTAIALDEDGHEIGRSSLVSSQGKLHLHVASEQATWRAGGIAYVSVEVTGSNGYVESNADVKCKVQVEGGELLAFGSARPATVERFADGEYTTYRGRALAVVYRASPGIAEIAVTGEGMPAASVGLEFK